MSDTKRTQRVERLIAEELAKLLVEELKDPRIGFSTITEVRVPGDLRSAKVFVSIYGSPEERQQSLEALQAAAGFFRREIAHRLRLKYTPELTFLRDETLDQAERLDALLDAASHGDEKPAEPTREIVPVQTSRSELAERARDFSQVRPNEERRKAKRRRVRRR